MKVETLERRHLDALARFLADLPEGDVTFIKEDVTDPAALLEGGGVREVAIDGDGAIAGLLLLVPLPGWSSHVGDLRLVVHPAHRGQGLGHQLARRALLAAAELGLRKVVVEVVAAQQGAVRLFTNLGWQGEALLTDHIRDRAGELRDLLLLAYLVEDSWSAMSVSGVEEALAELARGA